MAACIPNSMACRERRGKVTIQSSYWMVRGLRHRSCNLDRSLFFAYTRPRQHPEFVISLRQVFPLTLFLLRWIGGLFAERNADALVLGLLVAAAFLRLGWLALKSSSRDRDWKTIYPWLVLGLYRLISGAVTAAGRLRFGTNAAIVLRYEPVRVFCYIAVAGLALSVYSKLSTHKKPLSSQVRTTRIKGTVSSL